MIGRPLLSYCRGDYQSPKTYCIKRTKIENIQNLVIAQPLTTIGGAPHQLSKN